jgi:hypothetical protein
MAQDLSHLQFLLDLFQQPRSGDEIAEAGGYIYPWDPKIWE